MAIYIALCNDNVSYRKQLERLLDRENDRRLQADEVLYIDSYGNEEALFKAPLKYDLFILDVRSSGSTNMEIVRKLRDYGVTCPIACLTEVNYLTYHEGIYRHLDQEQPSQPLDPVFIEKHTRKRTLTTLIDYVLKTKESRIPTLKLSSGSTTHAVKVPDIIYAVPHGHLVDVYLSGGRTLQMLGELHDFRRLAENHPSLYPLGRKLVVNLAHITAVEPGQLRLSNGYSLPFPLLERSRLNAAFQRFKAAST